MLSCLSVLLLLPLGTASKGDQATILNEGCQCTHGSVCDGCQGKQGFDESQSVTPSYKRVMCYPVVMAYAALNNSSLAPDITVLRAMSTPCACSNGQCTCCTGFILAQLGYNIQQRGCINVTYEPDDLTFTVAVGINDRVFYRNTLSGNNPQPACISMPRVPSIKLCAVFSNVYFVGRNLHMCIDMEGRWRGTSMFKVSYDCIRIGFNGVALLKPEDGGGLPHGTFVTGEDEEYDDLEDDYL